MRNREKPAVAEGGPGARAAAIKGALRATSEEELWLDRLRLLSTLGSKGESESPNTTQVSGPADDDPGVVALAGGSKGRRFASRLRTLEFWDDVLSLAREHKRLGRPRHKRAADIRAALILETGRDYSEALAAMAERDVKAFIRTILKGTPDLWEK